MTGFTLPITLPLTWTAPRASQFWAGQDRDLKVKVFISRPDGVTWTDISDYVTYIHRKRGDVASVGTGQTGADVMSQTCTVRIANARRFDVAWDENTAADELYIVGDEADVVGDSHDSAALFIDKLFGVTHKDIALGDSFHPLDRNSSWNQFDVNGDGELEYAPLLFPRREIVIDVAAVPVNTTPGPADWVRIFHGYLGDGIEADAAGSEIVIECRDVMKLLMDTFIEVKRTYGSEAGVPAEVVMQQIIDDNIANGPRIYCPISPGLMIKPYECGYKTVADALVEIANQCGWWIGSRWIPDYNDFRLTFMAPPRGKDASCADWSFDWTRDILMQTLKISDREIRNVVCLTYRNEATGMHETITVYDQRSIDAFGRRAMGIEEADTSLINTRAEALAMAEAALHDQKDLPALTEIELPFLPTLDIFDGILINNPLLSSTQDFYAVNTAEDVLEVRGDKLTARTRVVAAGRVMGGLWKWRRMETRPGSPGYPSPYLAQRYTWRDDFLHAPFDPGLLKVEAQVGGAVYEIDPDAPHVLRLRIPGADTAQYITLRGLIAARADIVSGVILRARVRLPQLQGTARAQRFHLALHTPTGSRTDYQVAFASYWYDQTKFALFRGPSYWGPNIWGTPFEITPNEWHTVEIRLLLSGSIELYVDSVLMDYAPYAMSPLFTALRFTSVIGLRNDTSAYGELTADLDWVEYEALPLS